MGDDETVNSRKAKVKAQRDERLSASSSEIEEDFIDATQDTSYSKIALRKVLAMDFSNQSTYVQLGIGGATGWFTGVMVGRVGKAMAAALGGSILLLNMGTRAGYIAVDWEKVDTDMRAASDTVNEKLQQQTNDKQTKFILEKGSIFVRRNLVTVGGFAAGFFLGMAT